MERVVDRIEPEPVDAPVEPEAHGIEIGLDHPGIVKVHLRLGGEERVQIVLPAPRLPRPGGAAEDGHPVVGRAAVGPGIGPDVPVRAGVVAGLTAFLEPGVPVRGMAGNLIDDQLHAKVVRALQQPVEIVERAEQRVDIAVVRDIVAHVLLRRSEDRRKPDHVDAERRDMVETPGDAGQVPDPVAVIVLERARVDLIDHRVPPPLVRFHRRPFVRLSREH